MGHASYATNCPFVTDDLFFEVDRNEAHRIKMAPLGDDYTIEYALSVDGKRYTIRVQKEAHMSWIDGELITLKVMHVYNTPVLEGGTSIDLQWFGSILHLWVGAEGTGVLNTCPRRGSTGVRLEDAVKEEHSTCLLDVSGVSVRFVSFPHEQSVRDTRYWMLRHGYTVVAPLTEMFLRVSDLGKALGMTDRIVFSFAPYTEEDLVPAGTLIILQKTP